MKKSAVDNTSKFTFIIFFTLVIYLSFNIASTFLIAITVGGLLALALRPLQKKLTKGKIGHRLSSFLVFILFIIMVIAPFGIFVKILINQAIMVQHYISSLDLSFDFIFTKIENLPFIKDYIPNKTELASQISEWIREYGTMISGIALKQAAQIPKLILQTIFILLSFLYFLLDGERFGRFINNVISLRDDIKTALIKSFKESSKSAIWSTLVASSAQAITIFLGYIILGIPSAFLAAGATFLFSYIPFIGSIPVVLAAVVYLYLNEQFIKIVIMLMIGIFTGVVDNIVRAKVLQGSKEELHPLIGLVSVLGGLEVFGFFGVLIGPIVAALLVSMCRVWSKIWNGGGSNNIDDQDIIGIPDERDPLT